MSWSDSIIKVSAPLIYAEAASFVNVNWSPAILTSSPTLRSSPVFTSPAKVALPPLVKLNNVALLFIKSKPLVPLFKLNVAAVLLDSIKSVFVPLIVKVPVISALPSMSRVSACNSPVISTPSDLVWNLTALSYLNSTYESLKHFTAQDPDPSNKPKLGVTLPSPYKYPCLVPFPSYICTPPPALSPYVNVK